MRSMTVAIAIALSWPLSPDVLVRLGNGTGQGGLGFLLGLCIAAVVSAMAADLIRPPALSGDGDDGTSSLLIAGLGLLPAMTMVIASRVSLALLLPTGLLVTAGYTFNEVFVYWFPNFGFSYLLLAAILCVHLAGERIALILQLVGAGLTVGTMTILVCLGLGSPGTTGLMPSPAISAIPFSAAAALVLFLGYDVPTPVSTGKSRLSAFLGLSGILVLFAGWSMVSSAHLPSDLLAESTIPHIQTARAVAGESGRILMGVAVIAGTCTAVNGLFLIARRSLAGLAAQNLLPGHRPGVFSAGIHVLIFSAMIAVMLASGLAGADILETYLEAALLLWLVFIAVQCLAVFRLLRGRNAIRALSAAAVGLLIAGAALLLLLTHGEAEDIVRFLTILLLSVALVSALWLRLNRGARWHPELISARRRV